MSTPTTDLRRKSISRGARDEDVHPGTVYRWLNDGLKDRAGRRVRLACSKRGGRVFIAQGDLDAFFAALSAEPGTTPVPPELRDFDRKAEEAGL